MTRLRGWRFVGQEIISGMLVVFAVGFGAAVMDAQTPAVPAGNAENGKAVLMKAKCFSCHGTVGQGGPGGRLAPKPVAFAAFRTFVRQGKVNSPATNRNWAGMPPFSTRFISDAELADLYAYLASIPEPPAPASIPLLAQP